MSNTKLLCPVCSSADFKHINHDFHLCGKCGILFNSGYTPLDYDDNYFLNDYKAQYGRSYLDDFQNIYDQSSDRIKKILKLVNCKIQGGLSLLDIGSAMGFFLKCAQDNGIKRLTGIEISEYAADYCVKEFDIQVIRSSFSDVKVDTTYNIITAWFFIEHCDDPSYVINQIYNILPEGGLFAFSVPSIFGPMFRFKRQEWIETHPKDHRVDFSPSSVKKILRNRGFKKIHVRPAGIHPERILSKESFLYKPFSFLYRQYSKLTGYSDTIEIYAVK